MSAHRHLTGKATCIGTFDTGLFSDNLHTAGDNLSSAVMRTHFAGRLALALILK